MAACCILSFFLFFCIVQFVVRKVFIFKPAKLLEETASDKTVTHVA